MYILTSSVNDYNQSGDYFECAWLEKPSISEIMRITERDEEYAKHILNGGGRIDFEGNWYYLTEMKSGEQYEHS